ncbi:HD-GYP domain-containing protein [Clostridium cochlearium]|uniref:HD-GYP domain-containing protein n=1 Tax=Clostridium cochlearium TaxID=1494 RepID=UPI0022E6387F|nr:HD-GYP domain-containing protein [Clostridium cochlearium]
MRLEFIDKVKDNEILGKSILTSDGQMLLKTGVRLTSNYLSKLKEMGVLYIYIKDDRLEDINVEDEEFIQLKQRTIKSVSDISKNIHGYTGKKFKEVISSIENLVNYIIDIGDVNKSLYDIKTYDNYTYLHSLDTCVMTSFLGIALGFKDEELKDLGIGASLHDIGKTEVPLKILNKKGKLNDEEFEEIKKHTLYGAKLLSGNKKLSKNIIDIVEQHHERIDGKGYPYKLCGCEISKYAKVVSLCDVYDAVSSDRCYRRKFSPNDAYELILGNSETMFDIDVVEKFKEIFSIYPLGACVKLSNGVEGYVIRQNRGFPDRPLIRVLYDSKTREPVQFYEINLLEHKNLVIEAIV